MALASFMFYIFVVFSCCFGFMLSLYYNFWLFNYLCLVLVYKWYFIDLQFVFCFCQRWCLLSYFFCLLAAFVILSAILFHNISPVASPVLGIVLFEIVLGAYIADLLYYQDVFVHFCSLLSFFALYLASDTNVL